MWIFYLWHLIFRWEPTEGFAFQDRDRVKSRSTFKSGLSFEPTLSGDRIWILDSTQLLSEASGFSREKKVQQLISSIHIRSVIKAIYKDWVRGSVTMNGLYICMYAAADPGGPGGPAPLTPKIFVKIMQFSGNFEGKPLFWAKCWAQSPPPGVKTWLGPLTKILDPPGMDGWDIPDMSHCRTPQVPSILDFQWTSVLINYPQLSY